MEGPSDRIYINHWIASEDPALREGLHYTIMFYGGRLLSHLGYKTEEDTETRDFIELSRLNHNACIVIDSDRSNEAAQLNATKIRIQAEFEQHDCLAWITYGRTIENYIEEKAFEEALKRTHPKLNDPLPVGKFADLTGGRRIDKVELARKIVEGRADLSVLDLESRVTKLVARIRLANGISPKVTAA